MKSYLQYCATQGDILSVGANKPLWLHQSTQAWVVLEGALDLFAMKTDQGKPSGPRQHIFRASKGQAVFGLKPEQCKSMTMVAVGVPGTRLSRMERRGLFVPGQEDAAAAVVDGWVEGLYSGCTLSPPPRDTQLVSPDVKQSLDPDKAVLSDHGVVWIRALQGHFHLLDEHVRADTGETVWAPLVGGVWLRPGENTVVQTTSTRQMAAAQPELGPLDDFHGLLMKNFTRLSLRDTQEQQKELLGEQAQASEAIESALGSLAEVLNGKSLESFATAGGDPLVTACQVVAGFLGIELRLPNEPLRDRDPMEAMERITRNSRVRVRTVTLSGHWWEHDTGAFIAFGEGDGRPLAVVPSRARGHKLFDPTDKTVVEIDEAVAHKLSQVAYTLYRPFPLKELSWWEAFKFGAKGLAADIWMILAMGICGGLLGLASPIATGLIFNSIIPSAARSQLWDMMTALVVVALTTTAFHITRSLAVLRLEGRMDSEVQAAVWDRLLALPVPFFRGYTAGDLANRANGIGAIRRILSGAILNSLLTSVFSLFSFALLFYYDWVLALIVAGLVTLAILVTAVLGWWELRYQRPMMDLEGRISGLVLQIIGGMDKLHVAGVEERAFNSWAGLFSRQKKLAYRSQLIRNVLQTFNAGLPILGTGLIFYWMVFQGHRLSTGDYMAFSTAFGNFLSAMLGMTMSFMSLLQIIPLYNRAKPILHSLPEFDENTSAPGSISGKIEISHLSFRYSPDGPMILRDVNINIKPGEFVALVGPSGSGKSTLIRLLLGFEKPHSGAVFYDAQDLEEVDKQAVRRQIGVVLQSGKLTPGDILSNIIGSANLTEDDAWEAAAMAGLAADIKAMPMGMHTVISEGGGTLSGGQSQRLLIARAIVKKPRIVFLDEATSALDNRTQAIVIESLEKLKSTRIAIAHRLSTIQHADRIVVLDAGQVVETGTFDQLMSQKGEFYKLAKRQIV